MVVVFCLFVRVWSNGWLNKQQTTNTADRGNNRFCYAEQNIIHCWFFLSLIVFGFEVSSFYRFTVSQMLVLVQ